MGPIMLGLGWAVVLAGCASGGAATSAPDGAAARTADNLPSATLGRDLPRPVVAGPRDPGADALVGSMREALGVAGAPAPGGEFRVSVDGLGNQSHVSPGEFAELCLRLADVLTRSGTAVGSGDGVIRFMVGGDEPADYELRGSAFLVKAEAAERWELYLTLHPAGAEWTVWRAEGPVWVPRHPRPDGMLLVFR